MIFDALREFYQSCCMRFGSWAFIWRHGECLEGGQKDSKDNVSSRHSAALSSSKPKRFLVNPNSMPLMDFQGAIFCCYHLANPKSHHAILLNILRSYLYLYPHDIGYLMTWLTSRHLAMLASALAEGMLPDIKIYEAHRLMNYLGFALVTDSTAGTRSGSFRSNIAEVHHLIRVSPGKNMGVSMVFPQFRCQWFKNYFISETSWNINTDLDFIVLHL